MTKQKVAITVGEPSPSDVPAKAIEPEIINGFSGSQYQIFTDALLSQVVNAVWTQGTTKEGADEKMLAATAGLKSVKPQDELEGMLGAQMVATHQAAMECYRRAMLPSMSLETRDKNLNQANKLVRSYAVLLESLQCYRGKGESRQKVTVEHVHVHSGGQAIVGNVVPTKRS